MEKETVELTKNGNKKRKFTDEQLKKYRAYQKDFIKNTYRAYTVKFGIHSEPEIIEVLDNCENITAYIRELIQEDIKRKSEENK